MDYAQLQAKLQTFGQEHLLAHWQTLDDAGRAKLAAQLAEIDFEQLTSLVQGRDETPNWSELASRATSPRAVRRDSPDNEFTADDARQRGEDALWRGQLGLILVAGGQGTRLGFEHPKGMFPLGPVSGRTLFQILIERLLALSRRFGVGIPLYLMTSSATHDETVEFLASHARFGLPAEDLRIFRQANMPAIDAQTGQLLLAAVDSLALSPDGHGGMLRALQISGCLADAAARGIEHLFYCQVDNPLAQICDPQLIGYHLLATSDMTTQVVRKREPLERVGNVVELDGKIQIIEYSDLPDEIAAQREPDGSLRLWAGNLAIHVFRRDFLERAAQQSGTLPFHRATKKMPSLDRSGNVVPPTAPNAVKFERFIFDLLPLARNAIVIESLASEAFAPVKNANGDASDTPAQAQEAMIARDRALLEAAGATIVPGIPIEISPLWALDVAEAARKLTPGLRITEPTYLTEG